jgi:Transposase DDE domain
LDKGHSEAGSLIERLYGSDALTISPGVSPKTRLLALTVWPLCIYRPHTTCRPLEMRARLLRKMIKGKMVSVLTSMVDPLRFPGGEIVDLSSQRWEIELGYRAIKQRLLGGEYTLRSKTPEISLRNEFRCLQLGHLGVAAWHVTEPSQQLARISERFAGISRSICFTPSAT